MRDRRTSITGAIWIHCQSVLVLALMLLPAVSRGQSGRDYLVQTWQSDDGLAQNWVTGMVQSPDGYLWIGTRYGGLARFDGVRFVQFTPQTTPALKDVQVERLAMDAQGGLWISMVNRSVTAMRDGRFELFRHPRVMPQDRLESFLATTGNKTLFTAESGVVAELDRDRGTDGWRILRPASEALAEQYSVYPAETFHQDRNGDIWYVARDHRLARFSAEGATFRLTNSAADVVRELFAFELDDEAPLPVSVTRVWPKLQAVGLANTTVKLVGEVDADFGGPTNPPGTVYTWQRVSGPGTVTFSEPAARETSATFSLNGVYRIRMIADHPDAGGPGVDEFDVYVGIAPPPVNGVESSAVLSYDATADTDGDSNWENLVTPGAGDWALTSSITRTASDPAPSLSFIDAAWSFLGGITGAGGTSSNLNAYSTGDASFEIWFKPASLPTSAQQVIWESGGDIGTSFVLNGSTLSFVVDDGSGNAANGAIASATLAPLPANDGFVHAVGVISLADDEIRLYLDGWLADTEAIPSVSDWCGTSASGLGKVDDTPIAGPPVASATVDFDPTGELAAQFTISGGSYAESATGGLDGSVGITMASKAPSNFTGNQSESYAAGEYTVGSSFTIGTYFKIGTLPTVGASTSFLRLGLTGGGTTNYASRAFSSINITNSSGAATFVINDGNGDNPTATFTLSAGQWYYYETTITRVELAGANEATKHDFSLFLSDASGTLGSLVSSDSATNDDGFTSDAAMDGVQFAAFKGHNASTGTGTVIDNFHVVAGAPGGTSTVNFNSLGGNDLLTQPIEEFAGQIAIFRFYDQTLNTTQISDLAGGPDPANIGPVASAGADVSGACGAPIALGDSASDDGKPIPATLTSLWRQLSGPDAATPFPAQASFANASAPATSATFGVPGSYTLRLEVDDGEIKVCDDVMATITPLTYASWAAGITFPPEKGDPDDNPDHDRFVNLWEWAFGYDPLSPNPTDPWFQYSTGTNGGNRVITLQLDVRRDRLPAISFEESSNLQSWDPAPTSTATPISETLMRWTSTTEAPLSEPRWFLRAKVSE